jgi:hypothetical protein
LLKELTGGDRRSIGRSDNVAKRVHKQPELFAELIRGLRAADPLVRMRAADAAEKVSRTQPEVLRPFKAELLRLMDEVSEQELRWHLAQMVPRLLLTAKERIGVAATFRCYLKDRSSIVRTCALQALADLAAQDESLRPEVEARLKTATRSGTAAMKARSRRLLKQFDAR